MSDPYVLATEMDSGFTFIADGPQCAIWVRLPVRYEYVELTISREHIDRTIRRADHEED